MHSTLCYTIVFINMQNLRIISHTCDKKYMYPTFLRLVRMCQNRLTLRGKNKGVTFIIQHLGAWSCLNIRTGPYEDISMQMKQGLCRCLLGKHDVVPTAENTRPCVTLHPKTACKLSDINFIQPFYTNTYTPSPNKLLCHIADTILLIKMVKTYDISVFKLLASHDLTSLLCN